GDDANGRVVLQVGVTHDQRPQACAKPQEHEAVLGVRVIRVGDQERFVIQEYRLRLGERDAVLPGIGSALALVPDKPKIGHSASYTYDVVPSPAPLAGLA